MKITCLASGSSGNAYLVEAGLSRILFEAGLSIDRLRSKGVTTNSFDLLCITHEHGDHAKYARDYQRRGVRVACSRGTADALDLGLYLDVPKHQPYSHFSAVIGSFPIIHDAAEPIGFIVDCRSERLVFVTDTASIPVKIEGITHLMIECNYSWKNLDAHKSISPSHRARVMGSHLDIDSVLEFLAKNDVSRLQEIYLMHLSDDHSDEAEFKRAIQARVGVPVWVCLKNGGVI